MIFTEFRFFAFFALVFGVYWTVRSHTARKVWLLVMSFAFYAAWDWRFLGLIVLSITVDYLVARGLSTSDVASKRKLLLTTSLVVNLGMLALFKYFDFFIDSAAALLSSVGFEPHLQSLRLVLPVGISFYTFQTLSYSIDVYRRQLEARRSLLDVALFVAFFPQLVAGPIVRAASFLPQLDRRALFSNVAVRSHLALFLFGFIKKACVADNVAVAADAFFANVTAYGSASAVLATLLYAIQIYCDFSGYSDMAIACAGLLGFDLGANFRAPYLARNLREFWQRWHISLSTWLRDYLYVSLGGNRLGAFRTYVNLIVVMVLGGLWHGAAWRFLVWGALHGIGLVVYRLWSRSSAAQPGHDRSASVRWLKGMLAWTLTFAWVALGWIFFRAQDLGSAWLAVRSILALVPSTATVVSQTQLDAAWWIVILGFAVAHFVMSRVSLRRLDGMPPIVFGLSWGALFAAALAFVRTEAQPFIYFQF